MEALHNLHIVITRPTAQASVWSQRLNESGAVTRTIPLLEIVPVSEPTQIRAIQNCILDFDLYKKAIFVSQNAVQHGFEWIENYWPQLPIGIDFFAVGDTTAKQLNNHGVRVTDLAQTQTGAMTSETLLESPALQKVADEKIIIFRGVGGRSHLGDELEARGAQVHYCELYERRLPQIAVQEFADLFQQLNQTDLNADVNDVVVTLHSGEALENLCNILNGFSSSVLSLNKSVLQKLILLVPSARILEQAQAAGFAKVFAAQNATDASMLQGLMDLKRNLKKV